MPDLVPRHELRTNRFTSFQIRQSLDGATGHELKAWIVLFLGYLQKISNILHPLRRLVLSVLAKMAFLE